MDLELLLRAENLNRLNCLGEKVSTYKEGGWVETIAYLAKIWKGEIDKQHRERERERETKITEYLEEDEKRSKDEDSLPLSPLSHKQKRKLKKKSKK